MWMAPNLHLFWHQRISHCSFDFIWKNIFKMFFFVLFKTLLYPALCSTTVNAPHHGNNRNLFQQNSFWSILNSLQSIFLPWHDFLNAINSYLSFLVQIPPVNWSLVGLLWYNFSSNSIFSKLFWPHSSAQAHKIAVKWMKKSKQQVLLFHQNKLMEKYWEKKSIWPHFANNLWVQL